MPKNVLFYVVGGLLGIIITIYVVYLLNFLLGKVLVVSRPDLQRAPEIANFNLEKFNELKI